MWKHHLAAVLLVAFLATAWADFTRQGCGCLRNPVGGLLTPQEIARVRAALTASGVPNTDAISDEALQAVLQFMLQNDFPGIVPADREGVLQIFLAFLQQLTSQYVPADDVIQKIISDLTSGAPGIVSPDLNLQLSDAVPAASLVLGLRNVPVNPQTLNLVLQNAARSFVSGSPLESPKSALSQLLAFLDSMDRRLAQIVQLDELNAVRRELETRYNLKNDLFEARYRRAVDSFHQNRASILASLNGLVYRGPDYEVQIQDAVSRLSQTFPGITSETARVILKILQATNSVGGTPTDLLGVLLTPEVDEPLRQLSPAEIVRIQEQVPAGMTPEQVAEAYGIFIAGLTSQGITPVGAPRSEVLRVFTDQLKAYFLTEGTAYDPRTFLLFVTRISVPQIPRGNEAFNIRIFEPQVLVDGAVRIAAPLENIYVEGRKSLIPHVIGIQGHSSDILRRLDSDTGSLGASPIRNIVNLRPRIVSGNAPRSQAFVFGSVTISGPDFDRVRASLRTRYPALTLRESQEPVVKVILQALGSGGVTLPSSGPDLANLLVRYITGIPTPPLADLDTLREFIPSLGNLGLKVSDQQLNIAYQQFILASHALGYHAPASAFPGIFEVALRYYLNTQPERRLGPDFINFLFANLDKIFRHIELINGQVLLTEDQIRRLFAPQGQQAPSTDAQRAIIRYLLARIPQDTLQAITTTDAAIKAFQDQLSQIISQYPGSEYFLTPDAISRLVSSINGVDDPQQIIDANALAYYGLGLNQQLPKGDGFESYIASNINRFLRIHRASSLSTPSFLQNLLSDRGQYTVPVPTHLLNQAPGPITAPAPVTISIGDNLNIPEDEFDQIVNSVSRNFDFLTRDSTQPLLSHIVGILKASGDGVTQATVSGSVRNYISQLPSDLSVSVPDRRLGQIIQNVDSDNTVTITGNGVRAGIAGSVLSHLAQPTPLPLPAVDQQVPYFSFLIDQYRRKFTRQQLRFGAPYADFLGDLLPKLPGSAAPFDIFSAPTLFSSYSPFFDGTSQISDMPLFTRVLGDAQGDPSSPGGPVSLPSLSQIVSAAGSLSSNGDLTGPIYGLMTDPEVKAIQDFAKSIGLHPGITGDMLRRFFSPARLALRLGYSDELKSRSDVVGFLQDFLRQHKETFTPENFLQSGLIDKVQQTINEKLAALKSGPGSNLVHGPKYVLFHKG